MSTIELREVTKHFGAFTAVKDLSLSVAAGEVVCLLGPVWLRQDDDIADCRGA